MNCAICGRIDTVFFLLCDCGAEPLCDTCHTWVRGYIVCLVKMFADRPCILGGVR